MLSIATFKWTTFSNVKTTLLLSTSNFTSLRNVETTFWIIAFAKIWKNKLELRTKHHFWAKNKISLILNTLKFVITASKVLKLYFLKNPYNALKRYITRTIFKSFHFVKCLLVSNPVRRVIQARYGYCSFNVRVMWTYIFWTFLKIIMSSSK